MKKASATGGNLSILLRLLVLLGCMEYTMPADAASLYYSLTIDKEPQILRQEVQGQLNEKIFIYCDSNNCHATGVLSNRLNATKMWKTQVQALKDGIHLLKDQVAHIKKNNIMREPFTVQVRIYCGYEADGHFKASWRLYVSEHTSTGKQREVDGESSLKNNRDLSAFLNKTSQGDCRAWLDEFNPQEGEKLEPTGLVKESTYISTSSSPATKPDGVQSSAMARNPSAFVLLLIIALLVLLQYLQ